jgi:hypothetical protein
MLHACFTPIALCFVYTSWRFYAFPGTNLLTRCHSASSLFSAIFVFQKSYTRNILRIGRNEARTSYFPDTRRSPKESQRGAREWPHHRVAPPRPCHRMVWAPWSTSDIALPPIKGLRRENPKLVSVSPSKVPQHRRHRRPISGDRSLCSSTLPGRGSSPGAISIDSIASTAISIDSTTISIDVVVSHDEEGVVLPRGWGFYR